METSTKNGTEINGAGLIEAPGPGIYYGVRPEVYHKWQAVSNSRLTKFARSPAHMRYEQEHPKEPTPAMVVGSAAHTALLEPELFEATYAVAERCSATKKDGDRCANTGGVVLGGLWYCGVKGHAPDGAGVSERIVLSPEDYDNCMGASAALRAHPRLSQLVVGPDVEREVSVVWVDEETGLLCKARLDAWNKKLGVLTDAKKVQDACPDAFGRELKNRGLYRQLAMYGDALAAHGEELKHLVFAVVEEQPPHGCAGYRVDEDTADFGGTEYRTLLAQYARCAEAGEWPGYPEDITEIGLPAWFWRQIENAEV